MPTIGLRSDHPPDQIPASHHDQREQTYRAERVEPLLGDDVEVRASVIRSKGRPAEPGGRAAVSDPVARARRAGDDEAMACRTPVVAWRNGSVPEVVADGETGFIVSSVEEMAAAVARVGELDPHLMRARVKGQFSAEAMVAGYERVYQRVLATGD